MTAAEQKPRVAVGGMLWKAYNYTPFVVVGETSRSWLVKPSGKVGWMEPKKLPKAKLPEGWLLSAEEWEDWRYRTHNACRIGMAVRDGNWSADQLRQIAEIIGWKEEPRKTR